MSRNDVTQFTSKKNPIYIHGIMHLTTDTTPGCSNNPSGVDDNPAGRTAMLGNTWTWSVTCWTISTGPGSGARSGSRSGTRSGDIYGGKDGWPAGWPAHHVVGLPPCVRAPNHVFGCPPVLKTPIHKLPFVPIEKLPISLEGDMYRII
jgi:hypothetical protein